jgi:antitoxin ChpS
MEIPRSEQPFEEGDRAVEQKKKPRYTLAELLAKCDYSQPRSSEEQEWLDAPPVGNELL